MDPHVQWLRRRILRRLTAAALSGFTIGAGATAALLVAIGRSPFDALPMAVLAGQSLVAAAVAWSLFTNPLDVRYLRSLVANPRQLRPVEITDPDPGVVAALGRLRFVPRATIWDDTVQPRPAFDLFQTPRETMTAAWSRGGAGWSLYSRLDDGRILVTDSTITTPHRDLVVNYCPRLGDDHGIVDLVAVHRRALDELRVNGVGIRADDGRLFLDSVAAEHDAYRGLGPLLGSFFNPTAEQYGFRLLVTPEPQELLGLALAEETQPVLAG